jgi:hypothetical protein
MYCTELLLCCAALHAVGGSCFSLLLTLRSVAATTYVYVHDPSCVTMC